ncbi:MAG: cysteine desulfurase family protein [Xanthobacteraceae bacterium]
MSKQIYLDWNATAPLRQEARMAALAAFDLVGNPSSVHGEGRAARRMIEEARGHVAALVGAEPRDVVFTSGGTEANVLALHPSQPDERLLVSAVEHPSVLAGGRFPAGAVERLPVNSEGQVDLSALGLRLRDLGGKALVSVMLANNETGVMQPISRIAPLVGAEGARLHVDAVQAAGRVDCSVALAADVLTLSGHKIGGPKGVGALIQRPAQRHKLIPVLRGGGQERGMRAGTENVAAIAGFGAAAQVLCKSFVAESTRMATLRERLERKLTAAAPNVTIFGAAAERLPNTTLFAVPGIKAETAIIALDLAGCALSSGAACSSGKVQASHVLAAMGVPVNLARGAIRLSLGPSTTESELDRFIEAWISVSGALLKNRAEIAA